MTAAAAVGTEAVCRCGRPIRLVEVGWVAVWAHTSPLRGARPHYASPRKAVQP